MLAIVNTTDQVQSSVKLLDAFKCNLKELTTKSALSACGQRSLACTCPVACYIDRVIHWHVSVFLCARFCQPFSFPSPLLLGFVSFFSTDVFQCDGCLFLSLHVGAHGWVVPLCQLWGHYLNLWAGCQ